MKQPAASQATLQTGSDGFTLLIPPPGIRAHLRGFLIFLVALAGLAVLGGLAVRQFLRAGGWLEWTLWLLGLGLLALLLRTMAVWSGTLLGHSFCRAAVRVAGRRLSVEMRGLRSREWTWDKDAVTALDEDEGVLWVLSQGRLDGFFAGRDRDELRWMAVLLRQALGAPADPPPLEGEIAVAYRLPGWEEARKGFVAIAPGRFGLRPRFKMGDGLGLRPGVAVARQMSGSTSIQPDDVAWGIGAGGQAVLRIHLHDHEGGEPTPLELSGAPLHELRSALDRFWEEPPAEATG